MNENGQIVVAVILLIAVYILSRKVQTWLVKRAYAKILKDLEGKGAAAPEAAVKLPYAKTGILNVGMKDYRPKALEFLVTHDLVGRTPEGTYFLKERGMTALAAMKQGAGGIEN
jgi:hypothetical protein